MTSQRLFRTAYVTQEMREKSVAPVYQDCESVEYLMSNREYDFEDIVNYLEGRLANFDPGQDVIISMGSNAVVAAVFFAIGRRFPEVQLGIYNGHGYNYFRVRTVIGSLDVKYLNPNKETSLV